MTAGRLAGTLGEIAKSTEEKNGQRYADVSASGSVEGDKLYLDATSSGNITFYRIALAASGNSASGDYRAFSTGEEDREGLAGGVRIGAG